MYGFDEKTPEAGGSNRLPAGINENVFLRDILFEPLKPESNDNVIQFLFSDANGASFKHLEWPLDYDKLVNLAKGWNKPQTEAEKWAKEQFTEQGQRVQHILSSFIPKDKCVFKADSFEEFAEGIIKLLGNQHTDKPVRLKIVYKKNSQYTSFPKKAYKAFIQPMSEPNRLRIDPKYDIVDAPEPDQDDSFTPSTEPAGEVSGKSW